MLDKQAKINYWLESSDRDVLVAQDTFNHHHYHYTLFFWQLVLEKLLKAIIIHHTDQSPLPVHDLVKLASSVKLTLDQTQLSQLQEITTFNLEARYDDYKHAFYKKATLEYTSHWVQICQELRQWLKQQI